MNTLDIIIVALLGVMLALGYRKGLVRQAIDLLGFFISIIVAYLAAPTLAAYLDEWFGIERYLRSHTPQGIPITQGAQVLLNIVSFILLYYLCKMLVSMFSQMTKSVTTLPVLSFFNHLGGLCLGLLKGIVIIAVMLLIMDLIPNDIQPNIYKQSYVVQSAPIWIHYIKKLGLVFFERFKDYLPAYSGS